MRLASAVPLRPEEGSWVRGDGALLIGDGSRSEWSSHAPGEEELDQDSEPDGFYWWLS